LAVHCHIHFHHPTKVGSVLPWDHAAIAATQRFHCDTLEAFNGYEPFLHNGVTYAESIKSLLFCTHRDTATIDHT